MPIYVTVQPNERTHAECLIYTTGAPMLAIHDPSASVMVTVGQSSGSAVCAAQFAAQLVRAGQQFEHEARRCAGLMGGAATEPVSAAAMRADAPVSPWPREGDS